MRFDEKIIPVHMLIDAFLSMHDPTKARAHGKHAAETGQYRSIIVLENEMAEEAMEILQNCRHQLGKDLSTKVVITDDVTSSFFAAEDRHQRHEEKMFSKGVLDLCTVSLTDWVDQYGRRKSTTWGSAKSVNLNVC